MGQTGEHRAGRTFLLGFGFFGVAVIWSLYNAYVPIFLKENFRLSSTLIGLVMTIDNVLAILLLPYLGALSDRTRTRLGRRRPYILVGSVLALVFFLLVPAANASERLALMMLVIVALNLSMALFRSPVIALMPDITPSRFRSQANGIINFMGGLGALLVYFGGKPLYDRRPSLPFLVGGLVMLAGCLLVVLLIREPHVAREEGERFSLGESWRALLGNLKDVFAGEKSLLAILLAILCWFVGFNAIETFFTSYAKYHLGMKESTGALILGFFSVTFMAGSLGAGFLAVRLGRRRTIRVGLRGGLRHHAAGADLEELPAPGGGLRGGRPGLVPGERQLAAHGGGHDDAAEGGRVHRPVLFLLPGRQHHRPAGGRGPDRRLRLRLADGFRLDPVRGGLFHHEPGAAGGGRVEPVRRD